MRGKKLLAAALPLCVAAVLLSGAQAAPAKVLVVTNDHHPCVDCSLPEATRPARFRTDSAFSQPKGAFSARFSRLRWRNWGGRAASGRGKLVIGYEESLLQARGWIRLGGRRRHLPDGCGHRASERIYTRAVVHVAAPKAFRGRYLVGLPRSGCETV